MDADVVFGVAPLDRDSALHLMERIRGRKLLAGFQGMPALDKKRMADIPVRLGDLGNRYPRVARIEINPLLVKDGMPLAVDAGIVLKPAEKMEKSAR